MDVSFVVPKIYDSNKNKGRFTNKIWDGKKRLGGGVFGFSLKRVKFSSKNFKKIQNYMLIYK